MKESQRKGLISVHVAVALFGFVGLFAKLVDLPAVIIVLGRVFFSSIFLWIFLRFKKQKIRLEEKNDYLWMVGAGAVLAIHWSSYMQSIQSSTVAVGTLTVSTFPIFVIFLEPYLFHEKLKKSDVFLESLYTFSRQYPITRNQCQIKSSNFSLFLCRSIRCFLLRFQCR